ncbi:MAG TPA: GNAT family N-acetyltransferase [Gaiellaceae bacterium]
MAVTSRAYREGDLRRMLALVQELWPGGRHAIGYAFMAQRLPYDDWDMRLWFEGDVLIAWGWSTGWRAPVGLSYEFRPGRVELLAEMLDWSGAAVTSIRAGDDEAAALLSAHGFEHDPEAPWLRWNARVLDEIEAPVMPDGYSLTTMAEYGDFAARAAAHRSAFGVPGRPSRFTEQVYEVIRREAPWRPELDCVVVGPDGSVAAYALAWLDEVNRVGELEPVGVRAEEQRRGLGRAVCLFALEQVKAAGAETALVGSRGDDAYPGPRALYESIGFRETWRNLVFARSAS